MFGILDIYISPCFRWRARRFFIWVLNFAGGHLLVFSSSYSLEAAFAGFLLSSINCCCLLFLCFYTWNLAPVKADIFTCDFVTWCHNVQWLWLLSLDRILLKKTHNSPLDFLLIIKLCFTSQIVHSAKTICSLATKTGT